ncbi:unnamed protein product [Aphanomyces euteiches]
MFVDSDKGMFDIVIVHKLDRFSRDKYDSAKYKRKLKVNGIQLLSVTENLDGSPESIILESVIEGMAEYYSKNLAREVMKGLKETAYQCKHTGGLPPIGYAVDAGTKKYIINEDERGIVETIFNMYDKGFGYNQIVTTLNEMGYRSRYGRPFAKMDAGKRSPGRQKAKELYLLSGLIVCGECLKNHGQDYAMMGNTKHSGRNKLKYVTFAANTSKAMS